MSRIVFRSLGNQNIAYTAHDDSVDNWHSYWKDQHHRIGGWCGQFDTYGDGLTQHSPETPVRKENMADYLASLAQHLLDNPESIEVVSRKFGCGANVRFVRFMAGVRFNEKKPQFYNRSELKVTSSASKRHDRRWEEVPSWADGSADALWRLTYQDYWSTLERYCAAHALYELAQDENIGTYIPHYFPPSVCGFQTGHGKDDERGVPCDTAALRDAYRACSAIIESYWSRMNCETCLRNYGNRAKPAVEAAVV
jgi:hypothetical protein